MLTWATHQPPHSSCTTITIWRITPKATQEIHYTKLENNKTQMLQPSRVNYKSCQVHLTWILLIPTNRITFEEKKILSFYQISVDGDLNQMLKNFTFTFWRPTTSKPIHAPNGRVILPFPSIY